MTMLKVVSLAETIEEGNKTLMIEVLMGIIEQIEEGSITGFLIGTTEGQGGGDVDGSSVGLSQAEISHVLITLLKEDWGNDS